MSLLKEQAYRIIAHPIVNRLVRALAFLIPYRFRVRLPVSGWVNLPVTNDNFIRVYGDGYDIAVNLAYWNGLGSYEPGMIFLLLKLMENCKVIFDVGAHHGVYTLLFGMAQKVESVYAFEPLPRAYSILEKNIQANDFSERIHLFPLALSAKNGSAPFYVPRWKNTTESSLVSDFRDDVMQINVSCSTIDTFVKQNKIDHIDLLKIDTEASEPRVLQGARQTIAKSRPLIICEVLYGHTEIQPNQFCEDNRYQPFHIKVGGLVKTDYIVGDHTYSALNYLFVPTEKIQSISILLEDLFQES